MIISKSCVARPFLYRAIVDISITGRSSVYTVSDNRPVKIAVWPSKTAKEYIYLI